LRIERLEAIGFKSFAERVEVVFQPGITAVVGPNGCGKSNISDAISWVLGEQSSKHLRGKKMEDMIFNGSDERKPLGMAEVNLLISNDNGTLSEHYRDVKQLMITRRLFRSGESEYFINKVPCRLKDIYDLFLDTGLGVKACSIIKQGEVNELLTSQPEQRRRLIEEAAGIEKFQVQKKDIEKKLENTQLNLERVEDIIGEVRKQVNSLKRQAAKTKVYNKLKQLINDLEGKILALEIKNIKSEKEPLQEELTLAIDEKLKVTAELATIESDLENLRFAVSSEESVLKDERNELYGIENDVNNLHSRVELLENEISHITGSKERSFQNLTIIEVQKQECEKRLSEAIAEIHSFDNSIENIHVEMLEKEKEVERLKDELSGKMFRIDEQNSKLKSSQSELLTLNNLIQEGKIRLDWMQKKIEGLNIEKEEALGRKNNLGKRVEELELLLSEIREKINVLRGERGRKNEELKNLEKEFEIEGEEQKNLKEKLAYAKSEFTSLEDFYKNHEGLTDGPRNILRRGSKQESYTPTFLSLSETLDARPGYETAIESVLKENIDAVVVPSIESTIEGVEYLKLENSGRCVFLPIHIKGYRDESEGMVENILSKDGVLGRAVDFVSFDEQYKVLLSYLLKDVILVDNFQHGIQIHRENGHKFTLVDLDGDIITPEGIVRGGSSSQSGSGLLLKKTRIKELKEEIKDIENKIDAKKQQIEDILTNISNKKSDIDILITSESEAKEREINLDKEFAIKVEEMKRMAEKVEEVKFEIEQLEYESQEIAGKMEQYEQKVAELSKIQAEIEHTILLFREEMGGLEEILNETQAVLTERKIEFAKRQEEKKRLEFQAESHRATISELLSRLDSEKNIVAKSSALLDERKKEIEETVEKIKSLDEKKVYQQELVERKNKEINDKNYIITESDHKRKEIKAVFENVSERVTLLDRRKTELDARYENQITNFNSRCNIPLIELLDTIAEAEVDDLKAELEKTRVKVEKIGLVNLEALDAYQKESERLEFLEKQKKDIVDSIESLSNNLKKLNKVSREKFKETFDRVNEKFNEVFNEFFSGGHAEMRMVDETESLEAGIEIIARPPGRRLQNVNLLSGGEKAMTFISLLFAVFLVKPSPFCLLDEVDAPLDEANVMRLGKFLKKMSNNTQFLVITHATRTMEVADILYGVTMEEAGVSRLVSVKLKEAETNLDKIEEDIDTTLDMNYGTTEGALA